MFCEHYCIAQINVSGAEIVPQYETVITDSIADCNSALLAAIEHFSDDCWDIFFAWELATVIDYFA